MGKERQRLGLLTEMIQKGECCICDNPVLYDAALRLYGKWLDEKAAEKARADAQAAEAFFIIVPCLYVNIWGLVLVSNSRRLI